MNPHFSPVLPDRAALDEAAVREALYVSAEGLSDQPPSLVGLLCGEEFVQFVCNRDLMPAAAEKGLPYMDSFEVVHEMIGSRCSDEQQYLVATRETAESLQLGGSGGWLSERWIDGVAMARRWARDGHRTAPATLDSLVRLTGIPSLPQLSERYSAKRLRAVISMLARKGSYEDLTGTVKGQWTKLLQHNESECRALRALTCTACSACRS